MTAEATYSLDPAPASGAKKGRRTAIIVIASIILLGAIVFAIVVFGVGFPPKPVRIAGAAMSPTLNDGDRILLSYQVEPLERGDIVALRYPDDPSKTFIKRIIGLPGDRVAVDGDGSLLINDVIQDEPFIERERNHDAVFKWRRSDYTQAPVPPNCYFVMGDNRDFSNESRSWGPVRRDLIWGKYVMRYWSGQ